MPKRAAGFEESSSDESGDEAHHAKRRRTSADESGDEAHHVKRRRTTA